MRGREEDDDNDNDDDEDGGGNHRIEPASIDEKMNEERLEDFAQARRTLNKSMDACASSQK